MNESNRIGILLFLHSRNELSMDEERELRTWRQLSPDNERLFRDMSDPEFVRRMMIDFYKEGEDIFSHLKTRIPYMEKSMVYNSDDIETDPLTASANEEMRMNFPEKDMADSGLSRTEFWNALLEGSRFSAEVEVLKGDRKDQMDGKKVKKKRKTVVRIIRIGGSLVAASAICFCLALAVYLIFGDNSNSSRFQASFQTTGNIKLFTHDFERGFKTARAHIEFGKTERGEPMDIFEGNPKAPDGQVYAMVTYLGNEEILQLPDGTRLWMYPNSIIFFPAHFSSDTIHLKLQGKAYFETTPKKHFIITVNEQQSTKSEIIIEPLPAAFDISAYPDDSVMNVNMMNGSALVSISGKPADQSLNLESGKKLSVSGGLSSFRPASDTSEILSLKYGQINMSNVGIREILSTVSQWYDVKIEYLGAMPEGKFNLKVPLESKLSVIIDMIKKQGVHITMQGKVITVVK